MDQKTSRVFVKSVVAHLQKTIRAHDDKDTDGLVACIEDHLKMIKMANGLPKKKRKTETKMKKKKSVEAVVVVSDTASK